MLSAAGQPDVGRPRNRSAVDSARDRRRDACRNRASRRAQAARTGRSLRRARCSFEVCAASRRTIHRTAAGNASRVRAPSRTRETRPRRSSRRRTDFKRPGRRPHSCFRPKLSPPVKRLTGRRLKGLAGACTCCSMAKSRQHVVFAEGGPGMRIALVGEAPGSEEDLQGIPFVGKSGQLLTQMLESIGIELPAATSRS